MLDHEIKSDGTEKKILFPGKVNDSVLIQLEMVHNLLQMFKCKQFKGTSLEKNPLTGLIRKNGLCTI